MPGPSSLKIYGERNSGTNFVEQFLRQNIDVNVLPGVVTGFSPSLIAARRLRSLAPVSGRKAVAKVRGKFFERTFGDYLGWKHMRPNPGRIGAQQLGTTAFVVVTKNPYAWILSMFKRPHDGAGTAPDLKTFIDRDYPVMAYENVDAGAMRPVAIWTEKLRGYRELQSLGAHVEVVQYEEFLRDQDAVLSRISSRFGFSRRSQDTVSVERDTKGIKREGGGNFYRDYYLEERWREKLNDQDVALINRDLDVGLVDQFGYKMIEH